LLPNRNCPAPRLRLGSGWGRREGGACGTRDRHAAAGKAGAAIGNARSGRLGHATRAVGRPRERASQKTRGPRGACPGGLGCWVRASWLADLSVEQALHLLQEGAARRAVHGGADALGRPLLRREHLTIAGLGLRLRSVPQPGTTAAGT